MLVVIVNALARPHRRVPDALKALVDDGVLWFAVSGKLPLANTSSDHRTGYAWCDHLGAICYATTTKISSTVVRVGNLICVTRLDVRPPVSYTIFPIADDFLQPEKAVLQLLFVHLRCDGSFTKSDISPTATPGPSSRSSSPASSSASSVSEILSDRWCIFGTRASRRSR